MERVYDIDVRLIQKKIFSEIFSCNYPINVELSEDKTRLTIKPIEGLTDEFAEEGASAVLTLIASKIKENATYLCRNGRSLEITQRHTRFEVSVKKRVLVLSIIKTDVIAVMTEDKGE